MADEPKKKGWRTREQMADVGGEKGKLHREIGVPEGEKIPAAKLKAAEHSKNPEIKRDAIRAKTMEGQRRIIRVRGEVDVKSFPRLHALAGSAGSTEVRREPVIEIRR